MTKDVLNKKSTITDKSASANTFFSCNIIFINRKVKIFTYNQFNQLLFSHDKFYMHKSKNKYKKSSRYTCNYSSYIYN